MMKRILSLKNNELWHHTSVHGEYQISKIKFHFSSPRSPVWSESRIIRVKGQSRLIAEETRDMLAEQWMSNS